MNVNIEETSALRRKLTIELEPVEITRELDRAYNELKRSVQLKGFRPGHAPRNLLERFFGDQVRGDVIQKLVKEYTDKALEEHDLKPVVEPEIVTEETDLKNSQLRFSAVFDLKPELMIKDYEGLKAPRAAIEVKEEEVDAAIERLRERSATLKKVEDRDAVEEGDFAMAHLEGFEGGKGIPGTKLEERIVRVAKDSLAHGLDEVLRGAKTGVEVRHERSYPEDYGEKDIAGKNVEWRATVRDIYTRVLPELDDEFARDQGEFDSLGALRSTVRADLERRAREEEDGKARQALLDLIIERNPLELPESLVVREERALESETASALEAAGLPHEEAHQRARQNPEDNKTRAEKRARATLIVDAIAAQEKIDVSDDEVGARVAEMVTRSGRQRDRVAEFYAKEENRAALKDAMRREKTLATLLERAQSEPETVPAAEQSGTPSSENPANG